MAHHLLCYRELMDKANLHGGVVMERNHSDRRWWEAPKAFASACNSCTRYHGYAKCDTYPDGIPGAVIRQSALGTNNYKEDFAEICGKKSMMALKVPINYKNYI